MASPQKIQKPTPKTVTCRCCGVRVNPNHLKRHLAKCNACQKPKQKKTSKKAPQKKLPAGYKARYSGSSVVGHIHASGDAFNVELMLSVNPKNVATQANDPLLQRETDIWSRYQLENFELSAVPVAGDTAVAGTTLYMGKWDNVTSPSGPTTVNIATKTGRPIPIGKGGRVAGGPRKDRWYSVVPSGDTSETTPYYMFCAKFGSTVSVFRPDTPWEGPVWQITATYTYTFDCPADTNAQGTLRVAPTAGLEADYVEKTGEPAQLIVHSTELRQVIQRQSHNRRPADGFLDWLYKAVGIVSDVVAAGSVLLPPPLDVIVGGGAMIVRALVSDEDGDTVAFHVYSNMGNAVSSDPIQSTTTRTTRLRFGTGSTYAQLTDPTPDYHVNASLSLGPPSATNDGYFGTPGQGMLLVPRREEGSAFQSEEVAVTQTSATYRFSMRDGLKVFKVNTKLGLWTPEPGANLQRIIYEEVDETGAVIMRQPHDRFFKQLFADEGPWNCEVDNERAAIYSTHLPDSYDPTDQITYTSGGTKLPFAYFIIVNTNPPSFFYRSEESVGFAVNPSLHAHPWRHELAHADAPDGRFALAVKNPVFGKASLYCDTGSSKRLRDENAQLRERMADLEKQLSSLLLDSDDE